MASFTLKNLPDGLLRDLREAAERDRRSLTQEIVYLLESTLRSRFVQPEPHMTNTDTQVAAWRQLAGKWESDDDQAAENEQLMERRTSGREINL